MEGMYNISWFDDFDTRDVEKFQDDLTRWADKNGTKAVMVFDKRSLGDIFKSEADDSCSIHRIFLHKITLDFICINGNMCILRTIYKTHGNQEIIYKVPKNWEGATLWYAFPFNKD